MPSLPDLSLESAPSSVTNAGLHVQLYLRPARDAWMSGMENEVHADYVAVLDCAPVTFGKREYYCGIRLVDLGSGQFARTRSDSLMLRELSKHFSGGKLLADDLKYVYVKQNPMWILPEVMLPEPQGETTEVTCRLVEACPWSRWVQDMRILRSGQSHDGRVVGGFRYNVAQTAGTVDQFDVFVIVQGTEGQLGDWTAVACVERVQTGQSLEEAFAEVSKRARLRRSSKVGTYLAAASSEKLLPHGVRPFVEKVKSGGKTSIVLKWSHTQPEAASTHEVDGTEIFGTGRIVSTANLLQDRAEVDHQLALTRRMACEVVCDSIDITVRQSVNIVSQLPSKIRTTRPGDWSNLREQLSTMLREIKGQASEIQVSAEDGSELDVFGQYFANRLMVACICGDIAAARELVKTKLVTVPLECKVSGRSFQDKELCAAFLAFRAIHWAAIFGHTEIVRLLTENGADRYSKTVTGFTSVHLAAMMGHGGLVEYLLNSWTPAELADLDRLRRGRLNEAPGHLAAAYDRSDDGPSLFRAYERGTITKDHNIASVLGARNGLGETPLHRAAAMNNTGAIRIIATALPGADAQEGLKASLDSPDGYGRTPLWHAAATGADEAIKHLLHLSATVDSPDVYGRTPLHIACREGHPKAVQILLEAGADVNRLTTAPCLSARHFAALAADIECLELLIQHGGKADLREMEGVEFGAVHIAAANGWLEGVKLLVKHGCGPNTSCSHYVRARGHSQIDGAVNVARIRYNNAMELAVRGGHGDLVEFLKGAESDR
jgi:ankyrin repeat protein